MYRLLCGLLIASVAVDGRGHDSHNTPELQHSNHIFNAIHSSMRQWGSSLNHNGMSFFIASVPEGTQLYHGASEEDRINGTEWLAFEPEHAQVFAHSRRSRPPPGDGGPPAPDGAPWHPPERLRGTQNDVPKQILKRRPLTHTAAQLARAQPHATQQPLGNDDPADEDQDHGYLHTYRAKRNLRLLYIDGQSAAKSNKGTLDSQDIVLLGENPVPQNGRHGGPPIKISDRDKERPGGPMGESYRAEKLCEMADREWEGRVHGFLRMELGFEIILCSFARDMEVERITQAQGSGRSGMGGGLLSLNYYQAVASRFDGIGGDRVQVDYHNFVTLFNHQGSVTFEESGLPRAVNKTQVLRPIRNLITKMALDDYSTSSTNWQSIIDMVISRYSDRIDHLATGMFSDLQSFQSNLAGALSPYIDFGNRNTSGEIERCSTHYLPHLPPPSSLAPNAILAVTSTICSELMRGANQESLHSAVEIVRKLKAWLGWSTWKRCRGCTSEEVCFVPVWPLGGKEDLEHPRCISNMSQVSSGYWGGFGRPGGRPPPHMD